jgi:ribose transport system substrate-binding protein
LYDVLNGWRPKAAERMMNWRSVAMTKDNVDKVLTALNVK